MELGVSKEDYLKVIYQLTKQYGSARVNRIAEELNYTPASTSVAVNKLEALGFELMAVVARHTRGNWLELTIREMQAHSRIDGRMMQGHLASLKYEQGGMMKVAKVKNGKVKIPLEACQFYQNTRGRIYGSVPVTLACSVGQMHMPESTALLRFWL